MWKMTEYQTRMVKTVFAMSRDSLLGDGVANVETFISNLRSMADLLEKDNEGKDKSRVAGGAGL